MSIDCSTDKPRAEGMILPKVSAVLITLNEETDVCRALDSVAWCDEVVVVDSGSTDRTMISVCRAQWPSDLGFF